MLFPSPAALRLGLTALAGSLLVPTFLASPAGAEEVYVRPGDGIFRFDGHGWGHGRGLNQWGAQGAATRGVSATQILQTYYPGTSALTIAQRPIRVLIQEDDGVDVHVSTASGLYARDLATNARYALPTTPKRWRIVADAAGMHLQHHNGTSWVTWSTGGRSTWTGPLQFEGPTVIRLQLPGGAAREYRGVVRAVRASTTGVHTVNALSLEHYLYGVVPRESPSYFHTEALRAQSVAARSYSAYKRDHAPSNAQWDICSTTQCQVYGGARYISSGGAVTELERPSTNAAVDATRNVVRAYQGAAIFAEFSSSNGGHSTAHSVFPYLAAKPDSWDALASPHHDWTGQVSVAQIEAKYPSVGRLLRLRVVTRDGYGEWGGRVKRVVLEGVSSSGTPTSVEATGGGIVTANQWPNSSSGIRSSWWKIRAALDARVMSHSADPTLVQPPGASRAEVVAIMRNVGTGSWSTSGLHLTIASPIGSPDPLAGKSTRPGRFTANLSRPGAAEIAPGEDAEFRISYDAAGVAPGTYTQRYRVRLGTGQVVGDPVSWDIEVQRAIFTAMRAGTSGVPAQPVTSDGPPPAVSPNGGVLLPRTGSVGVRLQFKNTGNVSWPVGGPVRLGTVPHDSASPSAGAGWHAPSRPAVLGGVVGADAATEVRPGQIGWFEFTLYGNSRPPGTLTELFDPVWDGRAWIGGATTRLYVVRTDPAVTRLAEMFSVPQSVTLQGYPAGTTDVVVRLRNIGAQTWAVGNGHLLGTASPHNRTTRLAGSGWLSPTRPSGLRGNVSRPAATAVYPGEVGEWRMPLSAARVAPGAYDEFVQLLVEGVEWFGPVVGPRVTVVPVKFAGTPVRVVSSALVVPSGGTGQAYIDVRNDGDVPWPVGADVRVASRTSGGSPAAHESWLSALRPTAITANLNRAGATDVRPGEVARFLFVLAGNGRAPGAYSERFGMLWEVWRWTGVDVLLRYSVR